MSLEKALKNNREKEISWLLNEKYKGEVTEEAKKDIERLKKGEPIDYLIGFIDFIDCKIDLSLKPLIPRQETEFWAKKAIKDIKKNKKKNIKCLDLFSGSGCVGVCLLKNCPKKIRVVHFAEIDKKALKQIKINLELNKVRKNYRIIKSNIFQKINEKYDYIFCNPPYISVKKKKMVEKSVYKFEPHKALFAKKDGLFFIEEILNEFKNYLKKDGKIYIEFDSCQKVKIENYLKKNNLSNYFFKKDQYKKQRYLIIKK